MRHLSLLESGIIGFFVGVVVSTYVLFVESMGFYLGSVLDYVSWHPFILSISTSGNSAFGNASLAVEFVGIVLVYIIYGLIVGFLIIKGGKLKWSALIILVILIIIVVFQQVTGVVPVQPASPVTYSNINVPPKQIKQPALPADQQYFGNEVAGDLNGDGVSDVAFIISRSDPDRGMLYYLVSSLTTDKGHVGTNLLYLGDKVEPKVISITDGIIGVTYVDHTSKATTTKVFYAHVESGNLNQLSIAGKGNGLYFGTVSIEGTAESFKPCGGDDMAIASASSTVLSDMRDQIMQISSSNGSTLPIFGVLTGSSTPAKTFALQRIVSLMPKGVCP